MTAHAKGHGTGHFIAERVTAIALLVLTPWFIVSVALLDGGYDGARAWAGQPLNAIGIGLFILITLYHTRLGLQVIVDDYIAKPGTRGILLGLSTVLTWAAGLISAYALYSISFGG
ncbi:MAG: succinate dehydrogenase, hydrophobic membrane anchor protein [Hyphomonadaceae bacterium]|nr:succinate dehydrogenase, hydrophobic membrane anchor protein [Hyphomonadaceae bacterium]